MTVLHAADLFAGAGGTSTGLARACQEASLTPTLLAVNHWKTAIETHQRNHPWARHMCRSLHEVDPRKEIPNRKLHILAASPECTHHSVARGGRPMVDQLRASAWLVVDWLSQLDVDNLLIENVKEFKSWGPLNAKNRPIKERRGEIYNAWKAAISSLGYTVEDRILNAADYGATTSRQRLFVLARRHGKAITWPTQTHTKAGTGPAKWRAAREIIDWTLPGQSIFGRKRPLAEKTLARISAGLKRFGVQPFILPHRQFEEMMVDSVEDPLRTITAHNGQDNYLIEPFLIPFFGERPTQGPRSHSLNDPVPAVTSHGAGALVQAFLVKYYGTGIASSLDAPLDTITATDRFGLVEIKGERFKLDITLRMLQPHELSAAMGFESAYQFAGTRRDQVRQIGNAVEVNNAHALCRSLIAA